jgi:hypothetical protein
VEDCVVCDGILKKYILSAVIGRGNKSHLIGWVGHVASRGKVRILYKVMFSGILTCDNTYF